jgi:hypothetical protein
MNEVEIEFQKVIGKNIKACLPQTPSRARASWPQTIDTACSGCRCPACCSPAGLSAQTWPWAGSHQCSGWLWPLEVSTSSSLAKWGGLPGGGGFGYFRRRVPPWKRLGMATLPSTTTASSYPVSLPPRETRRIRIRKRTAPSHQGSVGKNVGKKNKGP